MYSVKALRINFKVIFLLLLFTTFSCNEIVDDCVLFPAKPQIRTDNIANGKINEVFNSSIEGKVKNASESDFNFSFEVNGDLPKGISYSSNNNWLSFHGIPEETGAFNIEVNMHITQNCIDSEDEEGDCDDVCIFNSSDTKNFEFTVL